MDVLVIGHSWNANHMRCLSMLQEMSYLIVLLCHNGCVSDELPLMECRPYDIGEEKEPSFERMCSLKDHRSSGNFG